MLTATNMEEMSSNNGKKNSPSGTSLFEHEHSSWCQWSAAPVAPQQTKSISHSVVFANWPFQKISWCCFLFYFIFSFNKFEVRGQREINSLMLIRLRGEGGGKKSVKGRWPLRAAITQQTLVTDPCLLEQELNSLMLIWSVRVNGQRGMLNLRNFHRCTSLTDYDACTLWVRVCAGVIIASWCLSGEISTSGSPWKAGTHSCTKTHSHERTRTVWHLGTLSNQHRERPPLISALYSLTCTHTDTHKHTHGDEL